MKILSRILIVLLFVLLALLTVFLGLGLMTPEGYTGSFGKEINASQDKVWLILTDVENLPNVREEINSVEVLSTKDGYVDVWKEYAYTAVRDYFMKLKTVERTPKTKLVYKTMETNNGIEGEWTYELENRGTNRCYVRISENSKATNLLLRSYMKFSGRDMFLKSIYSFFYQLSQGRGFEIKVIATINFCSGQYIIHQTFQS